MTQNPNRLQKSDNSKSDNPKSDDRKPEILIPLYGAEAEEGTNPELKETRDSALCNIDSASRHEEEE